MNYVKCWLKIKITFSDIVVFFGKLNSVRFGQTTCVAFSAYTASPFQQKRLLQQCFFSVACVAGGVFYREIL